MITSQDPNAQGTVWLIDLDGGRTLARWTTWVDQDVVTDGRGQVWWSAFEAESPYRSAIMTARVGGEPIWFSDASSELLWDLQWTDGALVGMTSNSHIPAHLDLDGIGPPTLMTFGRHGAVGSLWVSADRSTMVTSEEWGGQVLSVESKDSALPRRTRIEAIHDRSPSRQMTGSWSSPTGAGERERSTSGRAGPGCF